MWKKKEDSEMIFACQRCGLEQDGEETDHGMWRMIPIACPECGGPIMPRVPRLDEIDDD